MEEIILKFYRISIIFLVLLFFSVGFVCAEDVNQTDDVDLQLADSDHLSVQNVKSYNDLFDDIEKPGDFNLTDDYTYNPKTDKYIRITVPVASGGNYTIEGNNHVIDGNNSAGLFRFEGGNVFINNLVIRNCNFSAIILDNCSLTTNNVSFENNFASNNYGAGVLALNNSEYYSNHDKFIENYGKYGAAISSDNSLVVVDDATFKNNRQVYWSLIYGDVSNISVLNTVFANITSRYATAIYNTGGRTYVYNSRFSRLYANATAGAIAVKDASNLIIQNCEFENVASAKNGGAVFIDMNAGSGKYLKGTTVVNRTLFKNCSSEFGGAILQLGGYLNVIYSDLINNHAVFNGGAVYASNTTFYAVDSIFDNNYGESIDEAVSFGGALYLDYSLDTEIEWCNFTNNRASEGGAIYLFDNTFAIKNTTSYGNGEFIHSYFPGKGSYFEDCTLNESNPDKYILEDEYLPSYAAFKGKQIVLNHINITGSVNDKYFDLRNFNAVTPVKDQGHMGACWAFGATGALESAFLIATNITLDLSENNVQNSGLRYSYYGDPSLTEGGLIFSGLTYFLSWLGVVNAEYDDYDELGKISPIIFAPDNYHILDAVVIDPENITAVKEALVKYGALTIFVEGANPNNAYYNQNTSASYCDNESRGNHFVTLVGWNDTFSKDNFRLTPPGDGAWILKNSWGTNWGDEGYYYLSYYDKVYTNNFVVGYVINNTEEYNKLYEYDIGGAYSYTAYEANESVSYINTFQSADNDLISAVGTYFDSADVGYTIKVYINGNQVYSQNGKSQYSGYQTIKLDKYVAVKYGDDFSVEIALANSKAVPFLKFTRLYFEKGNSVVTTSTGREDLSDFATTACLKVYTVDELNVTEDVITYYDSSKIEIPSNIEGAKITILKNGNMIGSATVQNGKATINVKLAPGNYSILTEFNDTGIINTLQVLSTIVFTSDKAIKMDYNDGTKCKVMVLDSNGKAFANQVVKFKINKKTYTKKTNADGYASIKIPKTVAPGKYELTATYNGLAISKKVKVKHVLKSASKVTVKKSAKSLVLKAVLKTSDNKPIKNKKVSFKLNGKKLSAKTNKKGVAKVTFKKATLNKLKAGKSYKIKIAYLKDTVKSTLKVKR